MAAREYYTSYAASEVTNTSSSTWTDASSLTFTATSGQDYIIFWSMELANKTNNSADAEFRINHDSTQVVYHNVESRNSAEYAAFAGFFKITGTGASTTITPQIQAETNGNTIAIRNIRLIALALGANDYYSESLGRTEVTTGGYYNYTNLTTLNFTPSVTGRWVMFGSSGVDYYATSAPAYGAFSLDTEYYEWPASPAEIGAGVKNVIPLFAAYDTEIHTSGTPLTNSWRGRSHAGSQPSGWTDNRILMLYAEDFENTRTAIAGDSISTTSNVESEAFNLTHTLSGNPHLVFATVSIEGTPANFNGTSTLTDNNGTIGTSVNRVYTTSGDRGSTRNFIAVREYTPGSVTISVNHASDALGTNTYTTKWMSSIVVMDLGSDEPGGTDASADLSSSSLSLTGYSPTVSSGAGSSLSASTLTITGRIPTTSATVSATASLDSSALALTGYIPTTSATRNFTSTLSTTQAVLLTGYISTVSSSVAPTHLIGVLNLSGFLPSIVTGTTTTLSSGSVSITGRVPTLSSSANTTTSISSLTITGYAPTATAAVNVSATLGSTQSITITGYNITSAVSGDVFITFGVGSLSLTGYAPTKSSSASLTTLSGLPIGVLGHSQSVAASSNSNPTSTSLLITGYGIAAADSDTAAINTGTLNLAGQTPTLTSTANVSTAVGSLAITNYNVSSSINYPRTLNASALSLVGYNVTSSTAVSYTVNIGSSNLTFTGAAPTYSVTAAVTTTFPSKYPWYGYWYGAPDKTLVIQGYEVQAGAPTDKSATLDFATEFPWYGNWYGTAKATLKFNGFTPSVLIVSVAAPAAGSLTITGRAPTTVASSPIVATLGVSSLTITPRAPSPAVNQSLTTSGINTLNITPRVPVVNSSVAKTTNVSALTITGHVPVIALGLSIIANAGVSNYTISGKTTTIATDTDITTSTGALTLTKFNVSTSYTVNANTDTSSLDIIGNIPVFSSSVSRTTGTVRNYNISPQIAFTSSSSDVETNVGTLTISGKEITYQFGTTAFLNRGILAITQYSPAVISTNDTLLGYQNLYFDAYDNAASAGVGVLPNSSSLTLTGFAPSIITSFGTFIGRTSLTITGRLQFTASQDGLVVVPATSNLSITNNLTSISVTPSPAVFGSTRNYIITGRVPVVLSTIGIDYSSIVITGNSATVSSSVAQTLQKTSLTVVGYVPVTAATASLETAEPQFIEILSDVAYTDVITYARAQRSELAINGFETVVSIAYDANVSTSELQIVSNTVESGINFTPAIGPHFLHLIGTGVIADPDAKVSFIGVQDLSLTANENDAGVYFRRRIGVIN